MNRAHRAFFVLAAAALFGIGLALVWWMSSAPTAPKALEVPADRGASLRVAQLEQELSVRDATIADLRERLRQLDSRARTEVPSAAEAAPVAPRAGDVTAPVAAPAPPGSLAAWLHEILPDKLGSLTAEDLALLEALDLRGAKITDADLARLAGLPRLRILVLRGAAITDAGLASLRGLPLASLELRSTQISGEGLASLPTATLQELHLSNTRVSGPDLARLPPCPELRVLKLNDLRVADADLEVFASLPAVRHLELDGTTITVAGVRRLLQLNPRLTRIELRRTGLSLADLADLRERYPACELVVDAPQVQNLFREGR